MKLKIKYRIYLQMFVLALLAYSCSENENPVSDATNDQARLNLLIKTTRANDVLNKGNDGNFASLALYIFNQKDQRREYSELIPEFTPERLQEISRSVNVSPQTKIIMQLPITTTRTRRSPHR